VAPPARPTAAPSVAAPGSPSAAPPKASSGSSDWSAIVAGLGLQGPAGQLAAHCVLVGRVKDLVRLRLDPAGDAFNRPQLVQKLTQALSQHYGEPVRVEIGLGDASASDATPARQQAQAADERMKAAEQAIEGDPAVRAMRDVFGATVQPGSVKPLN
jgi:DNA polymerase-3 subunit gamma/tau